MSAGDGARLVGAELAAAAAANADLSDAEQLTLLPTRFKPEDSRHERMVEAVKRDRAGRPVGARNIATRQALEFVRKVIGDPLVERARVMMHTPETLAAELGCTKLEAFDRLDAVRADLMRLYYATKAPVDGDGNAVVPHFNLAIGGAPAGIDPNWRPWHYVEEIQQNQPLPASPSAASHGQPSHGDDK